MQEGHGIPQPNKARKLPLIGVAVLLCVGAIVGYISVNQPQLPFTEKQVSPEDTTAIEPPPPQFSDEAFASFTAREQLPFNPEPLEKGVQIGGVVVYYHDLENLFLLENAPTPENYRNLDLWQAAANELEKRAIVLNEGIRVEYILPKELPLKYDPKLHAEVYDYYEDNELQHVSGELISVWFFNVEPPDIGLEAGQAQAQAVAQDLHSRIVEGLSMQEAAEILKSNENMKKIDQALERNAYTTFENITRNDQIIHDPQLNDIVWQLELDEVSPVLVGRDFTGEEWFDAYYAILHITEKELDKIPSFEQLYEQRRLEGFTLTLEEKQ